MNNDCRGSCETMCVSSCLGYCAGSSEGEAPGTQLRTIQEWAARDGIEIIDPDGFDRRDPLLWERRISIDEYLRGLPLCTIAPLGWRERG